MGFVFIKEDDDLIKVYEIIRDYVKHEDGLMDKRTMWNILVQSILIASASGIFVKWLEISTSDKIVNNCDNVLYTFNIFLIILSLCGIGLNCLTIWGVRAAAVAIWRLEQKWDFVYHQMGYSHAHRRFDEKEKNVPFTLPVPFVTGGHKPIWKKYLLDDVLRGDPTVKKYDWWSIPALLGKLLPICLPLLLIAVWLSVIVFSSSVLQKISCSHSVSAPAITPAPAPPAPVPAAGASAPCPTRCGESCR